MFGQSMAPPIQIAIRSMSALGERVQIVFTNSTSMAHPMHLHGHDFEVVEIDGERDFRTTARYCCRPAGLENYRCL